MLFKKDNLYVVNRQRDRERREDISGEFQRFNMKLNIIDAVDGDDPFFNVSDYEELTAQRFRGDKNFHKGRFACFLSHINAWKEIIKSKYDYGIIFEDDALILQYPNIILEKWAPKDADIVFINNRVNNYVRCALGKNIEIRENEPKFFPLNHIVSKLMDKNIYPGDSILFQAAIGTDGYMITKKAAHEMLIRTKQKKILTDVDWQIAFEGLCEQTIQRKELKKWHSFNTIKKENPPFDLPLNIYFIYPYLVKHRNVQSTLQP